MASIDIRKKLGPIYANIEKNPAIKSGLFSPGLKAACVSYDRKIDECEALAKRQKGLADILQASVKLINDCGTKNTELKTERDKAHTENAAKYSTAASEFNATLAKGDKADSADVLKKLQDLVNSFKKGVDDDKLHADKKEKLGADVIGALKKNGDTYERETKAIESANKQLTADGKRLEAQVRSIVTSYQATAKKNKDPKLQPDLTKLQADFQVMLEALETVVV